MILFTQFSFIGFLELYKTYNISILRSKTQGNKDKLSISCKLQLVGMYVYIKISPISPPIYIYIIHIYINIFTFFLQQFHFVGVLCLKKALNMTFFQNVKTNSLFLNILQMNKNELTHVKFSFCCRGVPTHL